VGNDEITQRGGRREIVTNLFERMQASKEKQQYTQVITVDPKMALGILGNRAPNREESRARIAKYAMDMKNGNWHLTHQGIAFDEYGHLIDGQNRMRAVVLSGCTILTLATYNASNETMLVIDTGGNRNPSDAMQIAFGLSGRISRMISAATSYCVNYESGNALLGVLQGKRFGNTNLAIENYFKQNPGLLRSAEFIAKMPRRDSILKESISCFMHYKISQKHDDADDFMKRLLTGEDIDSSSIIFVMRKQLLASRLKNHILEEGVIIKRIITTYNYHHTKKSFKDPAQILRRIKIDSGITIS
jgi:hypothetical protein